MASQKRARFPSVEVVDEPSRRDKQAKSALLVEAGGMITAGFGLSRPPTESVPSGIVDAVAGLTKRTKSSLLAKATEAAAGSLDLGLPTPSSDVPSVNYDGLEIYNFCLVSIDETGHVIRCTATQPEKPPIDLLAPGTTPTNVDTTCNPFDTPIAAQYIGHSSPANFAFTGDVRLWGLIPAQISIYQNISKHGFPYHEVVAINAKENTLGTLLPDLKGSPLDAIALKQARFAYARRTFDILRPAGLYFETDVVFQGVLQPVSDFLRDFFHQEQPAIHFSAYLGQYRGWNAVAVPSSFALRGSLEGISLNLFDLLKFKTIGVELLGDKQCNATSAHYEWQLDYGFFGVRPQGACPLATTNVN